MLIKYNNIFLLLVLAGTTFKYGDIFFAPYLIPYLVILLAFTGVCLSFRFSKSKSGVFLFQIFTQVCFLFIFLFSYKDLYSFLYNIINFSIPFLGFLSVFYLLNVIRYNSSVKIIYCMLVFATIYALIESAIRLSPFIYNPTSLVENFYLAKYESPFLYDSNAVAIYLLSYIAVGFYMLKYFNSEYDSKIKIITYMLIGCLCFTFSRAALVAFFVFYITFHWQQLKLSKKYFIFIIVLLASPVIINFIFELVKNDGSGLTKILIFEDMLTSIKNKTYFEMFYGYGIEEGGYIYSYESTRYAHALIPLLVGQVGLLGALVYFLFAIYINFKVKYKATPFLAAFFVVGLSYLNTNTESVFIAFSIISALFYSRYNNNKA